MGSRSTSRSTDPAEDTLVVGRILGPHGVRGEVKIELSTDVADRFSPGAELQCDGVGILTVRSVRGAARGPIVSFSGIDDRRAAAGLRGRNLRVSLSEARRATSGSYLWADLVGLRAQRIDGADLGQVTEVIRAGEVDVLVIQGEGRELLVPAIASVVREVDVAGGRVVVAPQEEA